MSAIKLTKHALDAVNASQSCARALGHDHVGCEHIFLSILAIRQASACKRLQLLGQSLEELEETLKSMVCVEASVCLQRGQLPMTARTRKVLDLADALAHTPGAPGRREGTPAGVVGTLEIVAAMMREGENAPAQLLFNAGLTLERFLSAGQSKNAPKEEGEDGGDGAEESEDDGEEDGKRGGRPRKTS